MKNVCDLASRMGSLLFDEKFSDITFMVECEIIPAHKNILYTCGDYFRSLISNDSEELSENELMFIDAPLEAFKLLMKYIYTSQLNVASMDLDLILEVLELAHRYGLEKLKMALCSHLQTVLTVEKVCTVFEMAHGLQLEQISEACCHFMDQVPEAILSSEALHDLSSGALSAILSRDTFCADEVDIFKAVEKWCARNSLQKNASEVLEKVRLALMPVLELASTVRNTGLIATDRLLDAIQRRESQATDLPFRGVRLYDENVATSARGASILTATVGRNFSSSSNHPPYREEMMPPNESNLTVDADTGLTIALSKPFLINRLAFRVSEKQADERSIFFSATACASYYIEVSVNLVDWVRVIDHSEHVCRANQTLPFGARVVRYIRIMPSEKASGGKKLEGNFAVSMLRACLDKAELALHEGFYAPEMNVASVFVGALSIECDGTHDGKIDGESSSPLSASRTTKHLIGSGSTTIQL
ncbi:BTB/POZ domain-containing protein 9 [Galendromus occidentalis]|uniref:BTB/POZ domain-containing protein 9 n=1 Tax=Galendromus occidentalis TaxID=34638 RepID=A0AAJ7L718_9ACAR|nr:BTB/POZ domain-containing protein 9 [Galendromus occidentalis]